MEANVYDFDKTIYNGDSTEHFYFYCLKKYPKIIFLLPVQGFYFLEFAFKIITKTQFKEKFYTFLRYIDDTEKEVSEFWDLKLGGIKKWYLDAQQANDIIISASPEFIIKPICSRLGIKYAFASKVDPHTGKYTGLNCWGEEKVVRLNSELPNTKIKKFFSDSYSDSPLAKLAEEAYLVKGNELKNW